MLWKWIVRGAMALGQNPKVRAWARRKALQVVNRIRSRSEKTVAGMLDAAQLDNPKPKTGRLIRTERDILKPGQVAVVDGKAFNIVRLISSNARETIYEAVEA